MLLLNDNILLKDVTPKSKGKTDSGIILPTTYIRKEYRVVLTGNKCKALKEGDVVRLHRGKKLQRFDYRGDELYLGCESRDVELVLNR